MPTFDGKNPRWILRAERFFNFYRLSEEEKMEAAVVAFDGRVLPGFSGRTGEGPFDAVRGLRQFRTTSTGSLHERGRALEQTGGVAEYRRAFIEQIASLENVPQPTALGQFISRVKKDIRAEVRLLGVLNKPWRWP